MEVGVAHFSAVYWYASFVREKKKIKTFEYSRDRPNNS
jgi:hypothetical protein